MTGEGQAVEPRKWRVLLDLSVKLSGMSSPKSQRDLILQTVHRLVGGKVRLWFCEKFFEIPGVVRLAEIPNDSPTPLMRQCCQSGEVCQVETIKENPKSKRKRKSFVVAVPMVARGDTIGVLQVERSSGNPFHAEEVDLLNGLASHAAAALTMQQQANIKNWRNEQLNLVRSVSNQITRINDITELCQQITRSIMETFHYYYVAIFTKDQSTNRIDFQAEAMFDGEQFLGKGPGREWNIELGRGLIGKVALRGEEIIANDVKNHPDFVPIENLPLTRSEFVIPLKTENKIVGILDIHSNQRDAFHEADQLVLHALADSIAVALQSANLFNDLQRRVEQIQTVREAGKVISSILDMDNMLQEVVDIIQKRFAYPYVHIFSVHDGRRMAIFRAGSGAHSQEAREKGLSYPVDNLTGVIPYVARTQKTYLVQDVSKDALYEPFPFCPCDTKSELAVPLMFGDEVQGVLDIQSDRPNDFDHQDVFICEALADTIAIAMRNASLYRSERWRRKVAESFREVAAMISSDIALSEVLDRILTELEANLPCEASAIWLVDDDDMVEGERQLRLAAAHNVEWEAMETAREGGMENWLKFALSQPEPIIRQPEDPIGPLGFAKNYSEEYSSIAAPLRVGNQPVGLLTLAHSTTGRYGSEAKGMTATFASYAAVAIENARLFEAAQEQAWISTVMLQVAEGAQSIETAEELLETVVRLTPLLAGVKGCAVLLRDATTSILSINNLYGIISDDSIVTRLLADSEGEGAILEELIATKDPYYFSPGEIGIVEDPEPGESWGYVALPLIARSDLIGILLVQFQARQSRFLHGDPLKKEQISILQGIAHQTAVGLENIRLLDNQQQETYVSAALLQVAQAIVGSDSVEDTLDTVVHITPILVGVEKCLIYLLDEMQSEYVLAQIYGVSRTMEDALRFINYDVGEYPLIDEIIRQNQPFSALMESAFMPPDEWHILKVLELDRAAHRFEQGTHLVMGFPLTVKGEVFGVLIVEEEIRSWTIHERRMEIINGIAQQTALAIQNDRLQYERLGRERLEREFQLAREIQKTFLPERLVNPEGWNIAVRWRPARQVGGDFYDVFELPNNRLGLVIADVSDKGMPAALFMTLSRTLIRATAFENLSPGACLEKVNNMLIQDAPHGMFVTVFYGILSVETGNFTYANAGHNLPIWIRRNENTIDVTQKGAMAIGILEDMRYEEFQLTMEDGDCLIFYTDGITEAFSPQDELYGEERLISSIQRSQAVTADEILDHIEQELDEFIGEGYPADDITILALCKEASNS